MISNWPVTASAPSAASASHSSGCGVCHAQNKGIDDPSVALPAPVPNLVRVRSGPLAGAEGTWAGLAGPRRFPAGVTLEAAFVRFGERPPVAIPIGDLERFA